jgi:hypothetical protein
MKRNAVLAILGFSLAIIIVLSAFVWYFADYQNQANKPSPTPTPAPTLPTPTPTPLADAILSPNNQTIDLKPYQPTYDQSTNSYVDSSYKQPVEFSLTLTQDLQVPCYVELFQGDEQIFNVSSATFLKYVTVYSLDASTNQYSITQTIQKQGTYRIDFYYNMFQVYANGFYEYHVVVQDSNSQGYVPQAHHKVSITSNTVQVLFINGNHG